MGKAGRLIALARRNEFFLGLGATLVGVLGVASAVLGITGQHFEIGTAILLATIAVIIAGIIHYRRMISPQVAVDDVLASDFDSSLPSILNCPCDMKLAAEAKKLASECYAGSVTIEPDTFEQLRAKNPYILACLTDQRGDFLGYFDVIPVRPEFAHSLMQGLITETQITHEDVLAPSDLAHCKYLFVSGLAVRGPNTHAGRRSASVLVWSLLKYLDRFYGGSRPQVFALAATREGDELLRRFKLNLDSAGASRKDGYRLYSLTLSRPEIAKRLACLPDWEKLCQLSWAHPEGAPKGNRKPRRPSLPEARAWKLAS